jgi:hypothetical protein
VCRLVTADLHSVGRDRALAVEKGELVRAADAYRCMAGSRQIENNRKMIKHWGLALELGSRMEHHATLLITSGYGPATYEL